MAGILHDVVDDTCESLHSIEREFDADVAKLVAGVSRLSYINQVYHAVQKKLFSEVILLNRELEWFICHVVDLM